MSEWSKVTAYAVKKGWKLMYDGQRISNGSNNIDHNDSDEYVAIEDNTRYKFKTYSEIMEYIDFLGLLWLTKS